MSSSSHKPATVWIAVTGIALILVAAGTLWFVMGDYRYMRIRNALLADVGEVGDFLWSGDAVPSDFLIERNVPGEFRVIADEVLGPAGSRGAGLESAVLLADHLVGTNKRHGGTIRKTAREAFEGVRDGQGNCSDFSQAYNGLALAADLPVREWGYFLDDFGGRGHVFNEIYDAERGKWILIDSIKSFYPVARTTGEPLSVLEFMERLAAGEGLEELATVPIDLAKFEANPFDEEGLLEYYRRGAGAFGLWYGNNVFTYDDHPLVRAAQPLPSAVRQTLAILSGIQPRLLILRTEQNQAAIDTMYRTRNVFLAAMLLAGTLAVTLATQLGLRSKSALARGGRGRGSLSESPGAAGS